MCPLNYILLSDLQIHMRVFVLRNYVCVCVGGGGLPLKSWVFQYGKNITSGDTPT